MSNEMTRRTAVKRFALGGAGLTLGAGAWGCGSTKSSAGSGKPDRKSVV